MSAVNWSRNSRTVETVELRARKAYRVFGYFGLSENLFFGEAFLHI